MPAYTAANFMADTKYLMDYFSNNLLGVVEKGTSAQKEACLFLIAGLGLKPLLGEIENLRGLIGGGNQNIPVSPDRYKLAYNTFLRVNLADRGIGAIVYGEAQGSSSEEIYASASALLGAEIAAIKNQLHAGGAGLPWSWILLGAGAFLAVGLLVHWLSQDVPEAIDFDITDRMAGVSDLPEPVYIEA